MDNHIWFILLIILLLLFSEQDNISRVIKESKIMKIVLFLFIPAGALISKNLALILAIIVSAIIINSSSINLLEGMENKDDDKSDNKEKKEDEESKESEEKSDEEADKKTDEKSEESASVEEGDGDTFKTIEDLRKERCKAQNGKKIFVDSTGKELTLSEISDKYPYIDFENEPCNPCDEKCGFTLSDRISDEEVLRRPKLSRDDE